MLKLRIVLSTLSLIGLLSSTGATAADTAPGVTQLLSQVQQSPSLKKGGYCSHYGSLKDPLNCPDLGQLTIQQIYARGWRVVAATVNSYNGERIFIIEEQ